MRGSNQFNAWTQWSRKRLAVGWVQWIPSFSVENEFLGRAGTEWQWATMYAFRRRKLSCSACGRDLEKLTSDTRTRAWGKATWAILSAAFRLRMAPWSPLWVLSLTFGQDNLSNGRCDCGFPEDGGRVSKTRAGVTIYLERVPLVRGEPGQVRVTDDEEYLSR